MTRDEIEAALANLAPKLDRLRALSTLDAFTAAASKGDPAAFAAFRAEADPIAAEVDAVMAAIGRALNEAEKKSATGNPAAMMTLAAKQRSAGAPHPLLSQWGDATPADWPACLAAADEHRRQFRFWASTVEDFRIRALKRIATL